MRAVVGSDPAIAMGLKSLQDIQNKYASKKRVISKKNDKRTTKSGIRKLACFDSLGGVSVKYQQKLILEQLKELTTLVKKTEKMVKKNKK